MMNRTKTEATCFFLSPRREKFIRQIGGQVIHRQDTSTYPEVLLGRKLTWSPNNMLSKAPSKMALMKTKTVRKKMES